jgi:hypothetical protein
MVDCICWMYWKTIGNAMRQAVTATVEKTIAANAVARRLPPSLPSIFS